VRILISMEMLYSEYYHFEGNVVKLVRILILMECCTVSILILREILFSAYSHFEGNFVQCVFSF
jgi:hypothetical protein